MQYNYRCSYFVVIIDGNVYVYESEKYKFDPPFLSLQAKKFLLVNQKFVLWQNFPVLVIKLILIVVLFLLECEDNEYLYISGLDNFKF